MVRETDQQMRIIVISPQEAYKGNRSLPYHHSLVLSNHRQKLSIAACSWSFEVDAFKTQGFTMDRTEVCWMSIGSSVYMSWKMLTYLIMSLPFREIRLTCIDTLHARKLEAEHSMSIFLFSNPLFLLLGILFSIFNHL